MKPIILWLTILLSTHGIGQDQLQSQKRDDYLAPELGNYYLIIVFTVKGHP